MFISSDILLSVNFIISITGQPQRSGMTAVTHCNYTFAHTMISRKIGADGAVKCVDDIHEISPHLF